jgi:hypothetical protein
MNKSKLGHRRRPIHYTLAGSNLGRRRCPIRYTLAGFFCACLVFVGMQLEASRHLLSSIKNDDMTSLPPVDVIPFIRHASVKNDDIATTPPVVDIPSIIHVYQYGKARTATTTQYNMVCLALFLHVQTYHPHLLKNTICSFHGQDDIETGKLIYHRNVPVAYKSHVEKIIPGDFEKSTAIFTTALTIKEAGETRENLKKQGFNVAIVQDMETLKSVGIEGMVKLYAKYFHLKDEHVIAMTKYFEVRDRLRQCCGMQMSKYFRNELLPIKQKRKNMKKHPFCNTLDIDAIEKQFMNDALYKLLDGYKLMRRINRPAMVDGKDNFDITALDLMTLQLTFLAL